MKVRSQQYAGPILLWITLFWVGAIPFAQAETEHALTSRTLAHDGFERRYVLYVPEEDPNGNALLPLVLNFHGGGGNAEHAMKTSLMHEIAARERFMMVYPEGTGREVMGKYMGAWNAGACCGNAAAQNIDDIGFISKLIDTLAQEYPVDLKRVYAMGLSNGAALSYRLACELSEKIAAIAPVGYNGEIAGCRPLQPVPVIHIHGLLDGCASYEGGHQCGGCFQSMLGPLGKLKSNSADGFPCTPVPELIKSWKVLNQLSDRSEVRHDYGSARCVLYGSGESGEIELCTDDNLGHRWPGGPVVGVCARRPQSVRCRKNLEAQGPYSDTLQASELIWEFLREQSL